MDDENKPPQISILKAKKCRNPLSDIDLETENVDENNTNTVKTARRVSFASNNSIKPFATDPEKNTIWDLTYEESLEKSESSGSVKSLHQSNIDKENFKDLNKTLVDDDELDLTPIPNVIEVNNAKYASKESNETILDSGMEFTEIININEDSIRRDTTRTDDVEYTVSISNFPIIPEITDFDMSIEETKMVPISIQLKSDNVSVVSENILSQLESLNTINTSLDDTQHLINYNLSTKKKSDFSKIIAGESIASFPNLTNMPLRGINSTSFVQNVSNKDETNFPEADEVKESKEQYETQPADDSILTFRKISMNETSFQSNITDILCLEDSITSVNNDGDSDVFLPVSPKVEMCHSNTHNEIIPLQKPEEISDDLPEPSFLDRLPLFDFSTLNDIKAKCKERDAKHEKYKKAFKQYLEKCNNNMKNKIEEHKKLKECLEEFDKIGKRINELYDDFEKCKPEKYIPESVEESPRLPEILTWKEKIVKLSEESEGYWNILSSNENFYKFNTLFKTIVLSVEVSEDGKVLNIELVGQISEKSLPIALYVHKIFMNKLAPGTLNSALGKQFDAFSLLDYVKITMENLLKIDKEFDALELKYGVQMDEHFKITFALISIKLVFSWRFIIDASDIENINGDSVTYCATVGQLRETEIRKCIQKSPRGFPFVKAFIESLHELKCQWENRELSNCETINTLSA